MTGRVQLVKGIPADTWDVLVVNDNKPTPIGTVSYEERDHDGGAGFFANIPGGPTLTLPNGWAFNTRQQAIDALVADHNERTNRP